MDLVLTYCNRTVIYYYNYYSASADGVDRTRANRPLTLQSHARSKATSLIDSKHATSRGIQVSTDSCISLTTVMDFSQLYRAYVTTCGHRLSCET